MATTPVVVAEITSRTLSLAVLDAGKIAALRSFSLEAKGEIAAFVAEHRITGVARASVLGPQNSLHFSTREEADSIRQPAALLAHLAKLPGGFQDAPFSVVVDAKTGLPPAPATPSPWIAAAVAAAEIESAKTRLAELGLAPAAVALAAPAQLGVIAASLPAADTALVILPGENDAHLAWVTSEGTQALALIPAGYGRILEAVQLGLGLKFKAAAGKLFYNENYDFSEAAPKIAGLLAPAIQPLLANAPATRLHVAGLVASQSWLTNALAAALNLTPWTPAGASLASRLKLDAGDLAILPPAAGTLPLASAGTNDAPWVQPTLESLAAKAKAVAPAPKSDVTAVTAAKPPLPRPVAVKPAAPAAKPVPVAIGSVKAPAPAKPTQPAKPKAASPAAPAPAPKPAPNPAPQPAPPETPANPARAAKNKTGPIIIATTVVVVSAVVGLAAFFKRPGNRPNNSQQPGVAAPVAPTPLPAPAIDPTDKFAADPRKFGNDRYRFEVTDKGFMQALSTAGEQVLVESAAGISLQGSYVAPDGRRRWFSAGGVDDTGYAAVVKKSVKAGITVFDVKVTHPRFELTQTFSCLPGSVKVTASFKPVDLHDSRGPVTAAHSVRVSPAALNPSQHVQTANDRITYALNTGKLDVSFDAKSWGVNGGEGRQTVNATDNGAAFLFTDSAEPNRNTLGYEITIP